MTLSATSATTPAPRLPPHIVGVFDPTENHYTGKERDTESGNDYFLARYYNSNTGRFLSPDWSAKYEPVPYANLSDPQSLNLYAYVRNNPLGVIDVDGHAGCGIEGVEVDCYATSAIAKDAIKSVDEGQSLRIGGISAKVKGKRVTYSYPDGSKVVLGGTHPWRDNNPGNEIAGPGVIGKDKGFVIFATAEDGWNALSANLQGHMNDSILATITSRTPMDNGIDPMLKGNDPAKYAAGVADSIGVSASTRLSQLSPAQFNQLVVGVASQEGYFAHGNTMSYTAPQ